MAEIGWNKPVICIFRERSKPESKPLVVLRARKIAVNQTVTSTYTGTVEDFYSLMGTVVYLTSSEGKTDCYVLCWFDGSEPDMARDFCQLRA